MNPDELLQRQEGGGGQGFRNKLGKQLKKRKETRWGARDNRVLAIRSRKIEVKNMGEGE